MLQEISVVFQWPQKVWSIAGTLEILVRYNGLGYRNRVCRSRTSGLD